MIIAIFVAVIVVAKQMNAYFPNKKDPLMLPAPKKSKRKSHLRLVKK